MHRFFILLIALFTFYTEGASQQTIEKDSVYLENPPPVDNTDPDDYEDEGEFEELNKSRFEEALKKYHQEDLTKQDFDKDSWKKATEGMDYTLEKKKERKKNQESANNDISLPNLNPAGITLLKWLFIFAAIGLIGYLIYQFIGEGNVFGRKSVSVKAPSVAIDLKHIEENLQEAELDPLIKQAIAQKQFALAIRLYYLATIKELSLSKAIVWKKDKTNIEYIREMRQHALFNSFKTTTHIFERIWYSDTVIDESDFVMIQPAFQDLLNKTRK